MTTRLACVVGARPNFVKIGPVLRGLQEHLPEVQRLLIHTGQHYDREMSDLFFSELNLPTPDVHLKVGSGTHGQQTGRILQRFEAWLLETDPRPAATVVVGDVNSTVACTLAAAKLNIPVIHIEAGLRSFDRRMPEEINRVVTDTIASLLLASEPAGVENLLNEGQDPDSIRLVGNVMIDVLHANLDQAKRLNFPDTLGLKPGGYCVVTLHRPSNVDDPQVLHCLCGLFKRLASQLPIVFPVHPRTRARLNDARLWDELAQIPGVTLSEPLGYLEFLSLSSQAKIVITDSGGLQEETTALNIPCLTMRTRTDRPITVHEGTSTLVGRDIELLERLFNDVLHDRYKKGQCPTLWDGQAGQRIAHEIGEFLSHVN